MVKEEVSIHLI